MENIAIIFAGGKGTRMGTEIPKQFLEINGKPIIIHTLELFQYNPNISKIYITTLENYIPYVKDLVKKYNINKTIDVIEGGDTAQDSIYNGLVRVYEDNKDNPLVILHDGVRPMIKNEIINNNINVAREKGNAITCIPAYETFILSEDGDKIDNVPLRKNSYIAQAPQTFFLNDILKVHETFRAKENKYGDAVDACNLCNILGIDTHIVQGNRGNIKITTPEDVYIFKAFLEYKEMEQALGTGLTNDFGSQQEEIKQSMR